MPEDAINLHDPVFDICDRLGVKATSVLHIDLRPDTATLTIAKENERGHKYVDEKTGDIATEKRSFTVRT